MDKKVKVAVLIEKGEIKIQEFPYPKLEKGGIIVKVRMSGICGTDKHGYKGEAVQYAGSPREIKGPYPAIPGHENVAEIVEIDNEARENYEFGGEKLKEGDRIVISPDIICGHCYYCRNNFGYTWCDNIRSYGHLLSTQYPYLLGGWAEYMYILPGSHIYKLPKDIPDEVGVLLEPMAVTYSVDVVKSHSSLPNEGFMPGDTVVIFGVGPLGMCHLIKVKLLGAGCIVAMDKSDFRLNMAKEFGANYTFNVDKNSLKERIGALKDLTHGLGGDLVIECAGVPQAVIEGIEMLRKGGTFLEVGHFVDVGEIKINPHRHLCAKNIRLIGMTNLAFTGYIPTINLLRNNMKIYNFAKLVTHRYKIKQAEEGLLKSMEPDSMKVVIVP
jgi:L-iditol 2-dehydrogenase